MTKKIALFAIAVLGFTTANAQPTNCPPPGGMMRVGEYHLELMDKRPICVTLLEDPVSGDFKGYFTINIHAPQFEVGEVTVEEKGDGNGECESDGTVTIVGNNEEDPDKIEVTVTGEAQEDEVCKFWIHVAGVGTLDPKVRVVGSNIMQTLQLEWLSDSIRDLGLQPGGEHDLLKQFMTEY